MNVTAALRDLEEDQAIINKEQVGDHRTSSCNLDALNIPSLRLGVKDGRETLRAYHKKVWRKRVPLPESSGGYDVFHNLTIVLKGVGDCGNAVHNQIDLHIVKAQGPENSTHVSPFHPIVSLDHV